MIEKKDLTIEEKLELAIDTLKLIEHQLREQTQNPIVWEARIFAFEALTELNVPIYSEKDNV